MINKTKMNFIEAVKQMTQGKKVRLIQHQGVLPWVYKDGEFQVLVGERTIIETFGLHHFEGEWEIFEEQNETLFDKIQGGSINHRERTYQNFFRPEDVKEALKKYRDWIYEKLYPDLLESEYNKAKEIFGEEMLK